jgi:adenylate cyclase
MLAINKALVTGPLAGANPDVTLPKVHRKDGRGPAVMFADVSRSMQLHERLGDQPARVLIDKLLGMAEKAVTVHRGRVIKHIGDEILAVMPNADAAVLAARDLMVEVDKCEEKDGVKPAMHVGLHSGGFIERGGEVYGDAVVVANRLTAYAKAGQILTSSASTPGISPLVRRSMRRLGAMDIRGRLEEVQVEEVDWREGADEEATFTGDASVRKAVNSRLVLGFRGREWKLGPRVKQVAIGRDPCADVSVHTTEASRNHGAIEIRNGGFFYSDTSLNGSYVTFGSSGEMLVQRTQVLLSGSGVICFGHPASEPGERLEFRVETVEQ